MHSQPHDKQYGPKQYVLVDNAVNLPYSTRKKLQIRKSLFNFQEQSNQQIQPFLKKQKPMIKSQSLPIPFEMSQTFIRYMLLYRITAFLCIISILVSLISIYNNNANQNILILVNNVITVALVISVISKFLLFVQHQKAKKVLQQQYWDIYCLIDLIIIIPHPTIWSQNQNNILSLLILLRIILPIKYYIYSSTYCDVRAYRIITTYGLNSNQHFFFAVKALAAGLAVFEVLLVQFASLFYFSHALYLVSAVGQIPMAFLDCFEVIIVTIPTVGFGEYDMPYLGQKIVILIILVIGAVFNSFITLTMLNQLNMTQDQLSSYRLIKKVKTRETIENISKNYIQNAISLLKTRKAHSSSSPSSTSPPQPNNYTQQLIRYDFKSSYKSNKNLYNSISYSDINNLFTYYRQSLIQYRLKSKQVDNMIAILLKVMGKQQIKEKFKYNQVIMEQFRSNMNNISREEEDNNNNYRKQLKCDDKDDKNVINSARKIKTVKQINNKNSNKNNNLKKSNSNGKNISTSNKLSASHKVSTNNNNNNINNINNNQIKVSINPPIKNRVTVNQFSPQNKYEADK